MAASMHRYSLEEELEENAKFTQEDIDHLKEWQSTQPHLPKVRDVDYSLFLHKHYYSDMDYTKICLDKYFTLRTHSPEHFRNRDPNSEVMRNAFNTIAVLPLERRTRKGFKIILIKLVDANPLIYNFDNTVTYMHAVMDACIREEGTLKGACRGYMFVFDMKGYSLEHVKQIRWTGLKKLVDYYMDAAPIRLISAHYVDTNKEAIDPHVERLIKSHVTDQEVLELCDFHQSLKSLDKFVPLCILPNEMGGQAGALMDLHRAQMAKLQSVRDWLIATEASYVVNEHVRPTGPLTELAVFGPEKRFTASAEDI